MKKPRLKDSPTIIADIAPPEPPARPPRISTAHILASDLPPHSWVVPDYLANELTVLAGARNAGKSWLALDFAIAVAGGGKAMGAIGCEAGDVLYIDLENGPRHIRWRLAEWFADPASQAELKRLTWITEAPALADESFIAILDEWRGAVPSPRLVVIDGAQPVPVSRTPGRTGYDAGRAAIGRLRRWSNALGIGVLFLYRTTGVGDPLAKSGEAARLLAAADATLWLERREGDGTLRISGRSVEDMQWSLEFYGTEWRLLGEATDIACSVQRQDIRRALALSDEPLSPSEIAAASELPVANVKKFLSRMLRTGEVDRFGRGLYGTPRRAQPVTNVTNVTLNEKNDAKTVP